MSKVLTVPEPSVYRAPKVPCGTFKFPNTFPMHLTASATVQPNSSGGVNAVALKNPTGQPMEILEIKFSLFCTITNAGNAGGTIGCKLDMGNFSMTNGFVPVALFGRMENQIAEENLGDSGSGASPGTVIGGYQNEFVWRLPHPLYVPADSVLIPQFQHRGLINNEVIVRISYSARSIAPGAAPPKKLAIPYAAFYAAKLIDAAVVGTDNSFETDLVNPFDEPIIIQRFGGRIFFIQNAFGSTFAQEATDLAGDQAGANYTVRMQDSFGRNLIQNFIPFRTAFSGVTRTWEVDRAVMDPKSYYMAYIQKATTYGGTAGLGTQAQISLIGHRVVGGK